MNDCLPEMAKKTRTTPLDQAFLARYLETLQKVGFRVEILTIDDDTHPRTQHRPDAWLRLDGPAGKADWACEVKYRIEPATLGPIIHRMKVLQQGAPRALLLTEHVTPQVAEALRNQGIAFVDTAGNAFIEDQGVFVWVTGRRPERIRGREGRGLHAAGLKLLFALLQRERPIMTYRQLADEAGIALGGVGWILRELERRTWIRRTGRNAVALHDAPAMLKRWDEGYADTLRPKLFVRACRRKTRAEITDFVHRIAEAELRQQILVGGELGAALLTNRLKPATATLHVPDTEATEVIRQLDLLPDKAGDVVLIHTFGCGNAHDHRGPDDILLADPLLLRAELLMRPDDRLREVAEIVRTEHIEPRWR